MRRKLTTGRPRTNLLDTAENRRDWRAVIADVCNKPDT